MGMSTPRFNIQQAEDQTQTVHNTTDLCSTVDDKSRRQQTFPASRSTNNQFQGRKITKLTETPKRGCWPASNEAVCDALRCSGPHARYTDVFNEFIALADRSGSLQLLVFNEEFLVSASHQLALTTSLPFVHTARRSYRLNGPVKCSDRGDVGGLLPATSRETREPVPRHAREDDADAIEGSPRAGDPLRRRARKRPSHGPTNPGAKSVKEHSRRRSPLGAPFAVGTSGTGRASKSKRLSATDISALASMKNAAKCDTWCELQNPVNHRVFERKLRPRPSCRGHVCLGVTHIVALRPRLRIAGAGPETGLPCASARGRPKCDSASTRDLNSRVVAHDRVVRPGCPGPRRCRAHLDCDPRSGGITR
ncbi:Hypothetical predicted protein [Olea europaea subsp. europaea]|uniref:Uncharacterized protein n=1 Tax=Olea europaea subsp. europaea TaxID=158383 RepID=A0A8S0V0G2_OLEEU|nr:Hypothetical predicted protein [Olea europaea subsp. europaea]